MLFRPCYRTKVCLLTPNCPIAAPLRLAASAHAPLAGSLTVTVYFTGNTGKKSYHRRITSAIKFSAQPLRHFFHGDRAYNAPNTFSTLSNQPQNVVTHPVSHELSDPVPLRLGSPTLIPQGFCAIAIPVRQKSSRRLVSCMHVIIMTGF